MAANKPIFVDRLPKDYSADAVEDAVREMVLGTDEQIADLKDAVAAMPAPAARYVPFPNYLQVRALSLQAQAGTYGGATDPRVARVSGYQGSGMTDGCPVQRFRFNPGIALQPFMKGPMLTAVGTGSVELVVIMGAIVIGIPHDLGRLPEWSRPFGSSGPNGPTGQLLQLSVSASPFASQQKMRLDCDFIPIFGKTQEDIERRLKHLCGFWDGTTVKSEHSFGTIGAESNFESPSFFREVSAEMVSTASQFSGLLLTTSWGLTAWSSAVHRNPAGAAVEGRTHAQVLDPTTSNQNDAMVNAPVVGLSGKSLAGIVVPTNYGGAATVTLAQILANGLQLSLQAGTVDFLVG